MSLLIKKARVIDPANRIDKVCDILVEKDKISKIAAEISAKNAEIINAKGMIAAPGLVDMHTHLRQPGREDAEDFKTAQAAAAKGGFTSIAAMPNTTPVCDNAGAVEYVISEAKRVGLINVFAIGAITKNQKGEELAEIADMKNAGAAAISDDGFSVKNSLLLRRALEYAKMFNMPVISHCEDLRLSQGGVMNEGFISTLLGLRGIPNISESSIVARDIALAEFVKSKIHIAHVSTRESVDIIRQAKQKGINVTCETCPHYFTLTDEAVRAFDVNTKMNPPLRTEADKRAVIEGIKDGSIDVIATDHAPHTEADKDIEFDKAPFGIIGLETALALAIDELVSKNIFKWEDLIKRMSLRPAEILGLSGKGGLSAGADADIVIIDPEKKWTFTKETIASKSKNSPFIGREFTGCAVTTICGGRVVYNF